MEDIVEFARARDNDGVCPLAQQAQDKHKWRRRLTDLAGNKKKTKVTNKAQKLKVKLTRTQSYLFDTCIYLSIPPLPIKLKPYF